MKIFQQMEQLTCNSGALFSISTLKEFHLFFSWTWLLTVFCFKFVQGEEICVALQTHINDVMLRRYSKARSVGGGSTNGDVSNNYKSASLEVYEKRIQDLTKAVEESQKNADQVSSKTILDE